MEGGERNRPRTSSARAAFAVVVMLAAGLAAQEAGRIEGRLVDGLGKPAAGVAVDLAEISRPTQTTDARGAFAFEGLPPGPHTLLLTFGDKSAVEVVEVVAGRTTRVEKTLQWDCSFAETLIVTSASRRSERVIDAPAAVSALTPEQIDRDTGLGEIPKLFESTPGAELTQSSLTDFKLNVRGYNGTVQRRVAVMIDGRNPAVPFLASQEWAAISFPPEDLASAELVRGPSSALYGANAFNGFLNLITKAPRDSLGGSARLTAGNLSSRRVDLRLARALGAGWYFKGVAGYYESDDFTVSRNETVEYSVPCAAGQTSDCLALEIEPLVSDRVEKLNYSARFDKDVSDSRSLVLEAGTADFSGISFTTSAGRFLFQDVERPWARFNFNTPRWNALGYYTGRDASDIQSLATGGLVYLDSFRAALEVQTRWPFAKARGQVVAGAFLSREEYDSANPAGRQTLLPRVFPDADLAAVFGQLDWDVSEKVKLVVAGRWDSNSLHESKFSPKAVLVWAPSPLHTLRASYNEAFQSPNYAEFYVRVGLAPPFDLSANEAICAANGVSCGFQSPIEFVAAGNKDLTVETIRGFEIGYKGVLGDKVYLTLDLYRTEVRDFVKILLPQLGTELGRTDPNFGPYAPPSELPAAEAERLLEGLMADLGPFFPFLTNELTGEPLIVFLAITNFGRLDSDGLEVGIDYAIDRDWTLEASFSLLDFEVREELTLAPINSNAPDQKGYLGLTYDRGRLAGSVRYRWVSDFRWSEGVIDGVVPSYSVLNLGANYAVNDSWSLGVNVSNALDDVHYEVFSGDLIRRTWLVHSSFSW